MVRASPRVEGLIQKGSERLDRRWNLLMALWKGLERKDTLWKGKRERREQDISEREQQLATREAALTGKAEPLEAAAGKRNRATPQGDGEKPSGGA